MPTIHRRLEGLGQSPIRAMTRAAVAARGINLSQGLCQVPPPPAIAEGVHRAMHAGMEACMYSRFEGVAALRSGIARRLAGYNGLRYDPEQEVVVTAGSSGAFAAAVLALANAGDEAVLFEPYYGYHLNFLRAVGVGARLVTLRPPDWAVDFDALAAACGPRTRFVVLNTPSNPCGKVWTREELRELARVAREKDLVVLTDEVYEYMAFDGSEHVSPAAVDDLRERTVTISSFSKTFSITGFRIGYAAAPPELARAIGLLTDLLYVCAPTPLQMAVAHALETLGDDYYRALREGYRSKRDRMCSALDAAGLAPLKPQGAYYVLADVAPLGFQDSQVAADHILAKAGVATVPGKAFYRGKEGRTLVRVCCAVEDAVLDEACRRLATLGQPARQAR